MSPNEYHKCLGAQKFLVRLILHMAIFGGVAQLS